MSLGESFLRPGRGGELIEFPAPSLEDKEALLSYYVGRSGVDVDSNRVAALVECMNPRLTHDWVRDIGLHASVFGTGAELIAYVETTNKRFLMASSPTAQDEGS